MKPKLTLSQARVMNLKKLINNWNRLLSKMTLETHGDLIIKIKEAEKEIEQIMIDNAEDFI